MTVFYTSDPHFGHGRIVELSHRPFSDVEEMNDALVYNWNSVVKPHDVVYVLGDVAIGRGALAQVSRLHGTKLCVAGNHDDFWVHHRRWQRAQFHYREAGFSGLYPDGFKKGHPLAGGKVVNLAHLPYRGGGDHTFTERYAEHRLEDEGVALLCGHVHDAWKVKAGPAGSLMINVGVDQWDFAPVAEGALEAMLS